MIFAKIQFKIKRIFTCDMIEAVQFRESHRFVPALEESVGDNFGEISNKNI